MKKLLSSLILTFYVTFVAIPASIAGELYYVQNAQKTNYLPKVQQKFKASGYVLKNNDPVYGVNNFINTVAILEQSDTGMYYYYDSSNDKVLNTNILKIFKDSNSKYKKLSDKNLISNFEATTAKVKKSANATQKKYSFEEPKANTVKTVTKTQTKSEDALTGYVAQIPAGTVFDVYLQSNLNTATAQKGDEVVSVLTKNWEYNGQVIAHQGSILRGAVTKAHAAGYAYKNGYVKFAFNQLEDVSGKVYNIKVEDIEFKVDSNGKAKDAVTRAVAGAAVGALAGLLIGALDENHNYAKATAIGAGAGAVTGLGTAAMEKGMDAEIPTYTEITVKLISPLNVVLTD